MQHKNAWMKRNKLSLRSTSVITTMCCCIQLVTHSNKKLHAFVVLAGEKCNACSTYTWCCNLLVEEKKPHTLFFDISRQIFIKDSEFL